MRFIGTWVLILLIKIVNSEETCKTSTQPKAKKPLLQKDWTKMWRSSHYCFIKCVYLCMNVCAYWVLCVVMSTQYGRITVNLAIWFLRWTVKSSCYNYTLMSVCNFRPSEDPCQGVLIMPVIAERAHYTSDIIYS